MKNWQFFILLGVILLISVIEWRQVEETQDILYHTDEIVTEISNWAYTGPLAE